MTKVFTTISFSSYFHLNYWLFGQVLCYANSLTLQVFFFLQIAFWTLYQATLMIIGRGLLTECFFPCRWHLSTSLTDTFHRISFSKIFMTSSAFSLSLSLTTWIRKHFFLEYCSWRSRLHSIVSTFAFKVFTSFFSFEICISFPFYLLPSPQISH